MTYEGIIVAIGTSHHVYTTGSRHVFDCSAPV